MRTYINDFELTRILVGDTIEVMSKTLSNVTKDEWFIKGPLFVIIGAALWGTETIFRVHLNQRFDSEVLVFHEHLFCIAFTLPLLFTSWRQALNAPFSSWFYLF